jgi:uncharacterized membrane protein
VEPSSRPVPYPTSPVRGDYSGAVASDNPAMSDLAHIGPVQLMSVGFEPGANFEGRIADELAKLQKDGTIRLLDLLFVARDTDSDELVVLEHQEETMGSVVGALLGLQLGGEQAQGERSFGMSTAEIEEMGAALPPGGAAGLLLIEHVWARDLQRAIRDAGGKPLGDEFLTPETVAAMEPQLAAMAASVRASES